MPVRGASEALTGAIMNADAWSGVLSPAMVAATIALTWYRLALATSSVPGLRFMPRSLRPADM